MEKKTTTKEANLGIKLETIKVRLTLIEDLLGTASGNKELYADYAAKYLA